MIKNYVVLFIVILFAISSNSAHAKGIASESFTLQNGLQVVVIPNHKVPAVAQVMCYKIGGIDDPYGKSGIAHFLEHLMFKGTAKVPNGEFSSRIARNGGNDNAFTSHDYTAYFQMIAKEKLPMIMELEADRMRGLLFDKQETLKEREVILEERNMRIDNEPRALLLEQMSATLFLNHPYHRPVIGWRHEMEGLTLEDARNAYHTFYAPNNAILVVAGDVTAEELRPLAEKYFGPIEKSTLPVRMELKEPPAIAKRTVELRDANVHVPELIRYYIAPNATPALLKQVAALMVMEHILGGGDTSRLYQSLVIDQGIAASVNTEYDPFTKGPSIFSISVTPRQGQNLGAVEQAVDKELKHFLTHPLTNAELIRTKQLLHAENTYDRESFKTLAFLFAQIISTGLPLTYIDDLDSMINKVTIDDVTQAAKGVLIDKQSVTGTLLPTVMTEK